LITLKDVLLPAREDGYAVGAFNCMNMEIVQAIGEAARLERSPVIIQASQGAVKYAGLHYITGLVGIVAAEIDVPLVLHLDHGSDFAQIVQCIRAGFTSVMVDASRYPLAENIEKTRKIVEIGRAAGVSVEAELGQIGGVEDEVRVLDRETAFTDPDEARDFVRATGVDALAVAIGTAHGPYAGEPDLDFARLAHIRRQVDCPLVLHGSSGLPEESLRKAVEMGICKINIDTNIREAFTGTLRAALDGDPGSIDPRKALTAAKEAAIAVIREKIRIFGSSGRA